MAIRIFESKILEIKSLNPSVKYLKFSLPKNFEFEAGQYVSLSVFVNGKKFRIPYSFATVPNDKFAEFCIKLVENGKSSNFIKTLKKGDEIELFGPAGKFIVNEYSKDNDLIFVSAGTGISTFIGMIPELLRKGFRNKIILLKGFNNEDEILYEKEFLKLQKKYKNFEFHNILSQPKDKNFKDKGYVQNFLDKYTPKNFKGDFYLCGLKEMIDIAVKKLERKGIKENRIFFEKYD
ncbi:MAG: FAD-dependent oxidoreductase [Nanoarchaeota archaeon]|nr:FAD-dependent oxidoreductase [Nanoarchaeota archaeon]